MNPLKDIIDQEITHIVPANFGVSMSRSIVKSLQNKQEAKRQQIENLKLLGFIFLVIGIGYFMDVQKWTFSIHISKNFMNKIVLNTIGIGLLLAFAFSEFKMYNKKSFVK